MNVRERGFAKTGAQARKEHGTVADELNEGELRVAQELAFAVLREAFHDLAAHLTFDGGMTPESLAILEGRLEAALARAVDARAEPVHPKVGVHGVRQVRQVLRDAHAKVLREHSGRLGEGV